MGLYSTSLHCGFSLNEKKTAMDIGQNGNKGEIGTALLDGGGSKSGRDSIGRGGLREFLNNMSGIF